MQALLKTLLEKNISIAMDNNKIILRGDTDTLPAETLAEIRNNKQLIIDFLTKNQVDVESDLDQTYHPIETCQLPIQAGCYPLSFYQEGIWVHSLLYPESNAYHMGSVYHIRGVFDGFRLKHAIDILRSRH